MAAYYLDTSALAKRYVQEAGTAWVLNLTDVITGHDLYTVRVTGPEMIAATMPFTWPLHSPCSRCAS